MSIRDELQALLNAYGAAYRARDASGCAATFVPEGELYSPYAPPARGRKAIEATHREWAEADSEGKQLSITAVGSSGDLAWCLAAFSEGQATASGTSLSIFERQPEGHWLIRICSLNSNDIQHNTLP